MAQYKHTKKTHKQKRRAYKFAKVAIVAVTFALLALIGVGIDWVINNISKSDAEISRLTTSSVQSASISAYRTKYFQFQAPEEWVTVADDEESDSKFVFVKNNGPLVTERLIVFVDRPLHTSQADMPFTHVLPINITAGSKLETIGKTSAHCSESMKDKVLPANSRIEHEGVEFVCNRGSQQYNVIIGESGGNELLQFDTPNARDVTLTLVYSNLTAYPGNGDLYRIVDTFVTL